MNALNRTHYELFGLPEGFAVDASALDAAYRSVQGAVHPDRHSAGSATDRRIAMQLAAQANEAYRTLRDPLQRAAYLCALHGVDPQLHSNTAMPAAFLAQQMQWRERLDDAREAGDCGAVQTLRGELERARATLLAGIAEAIDGARDFAAAAALVRQLTFVERFEADVDAAGERLGLH